MRTLRERLSTPGTLVIGIEEAPSYLHNFSFDEQDDEITLSWTDDEGYVFEETFFLDEVNPEVEVFTLTRVV